MLLVPWELDPTIDLRLLGSWLHEPPKKVAPIFESPTSPARGNTKSRATLGKQEYRAPHCKHTNSCALSLRSKVLGNVDIIPQFAEVKVLKLHLPEYGPCNPYTLNFKS